MLLRRIITHVKDQNWFAVGIEFVIVVLGILIAFQITNWADNAREQNNLDEAEIILKEDLLSNYFISYERLAISECRISSLKNLGNKLLEQNDYWLGLPISNSEITKGHGLHPVLFTPYSTNWGSRIWDAELARGTFDTMDNRRLLSMGQIFRLASYAVDVQGDIIKAEGRLKILGNTIALSQTDRLRYYELVSETDTNSRNLERIAQSIITRIELMGLELDHGHYKIFSKNVEDNINRLTSLNGKCVKPFSALSFDIAAIGPELVI